MSRTYHILVPEYIPLENKGEEAIVRGIMDVLYPDGNCEIHLFDMEAVKYRFQDGLHIYPGGWFFSFWLASEFGLGASWEKIRDSVLSLARNALHKIWPKWVYNWCTPLSKTASIIENIKSGTIPLKDERKWLDLLLKCDYVIAGHDGALDERVCHVIDLMNKHGKSFGVFGIEFRASFKSKAIIEVEKKTLTKSDFFYCRTLGSLKTVQKYIPNINSKLLPDPAFGMRPAPQDNINKIIIKEELEDLFRKPLVMCTCCEPAPIARFAFEDIKRPSLKLDAHRTLFADLIKYIVRKYDVNVLFLPHAFGPGKALDDRIVAKDIIERTQLPENKVYLLKSECTARELKALIKQAELLIAERIHSMIGATGVHTPFLCMGSRTDRRIKGIIDEMCDMEDSIYYLNKPSLAELEAKFDDIWKRKYNIKKRLCDISNSLVKELEKEAKEMRQKIEKARNE